MHTLGKLDLADWCNDSLYTGAYTGLGKYPLEVEATFKF